MTLPLYDSVPLPQGDIVPETLGEAVPVTLKEGEPVGQDDTVPHGDAVGDRDSEGDPEKELEVVGDCVWEMLPVAVTLTVPLIEYVDEVVKEPLLLGLPLAREESEPVALGECDVEKHPVALPQGEAVALIVGEALRLLQGDAEKEPLVDPEEDGEALTQPEAVLVAQGEMLGEKVTDTVAEDEKQVDMVPETLPVAQPLPEMETLGEPDEDGVAVEQMDALPVAHGVAEPL